MVVQSNQVVAPYLYTAVDADNEGADLTAGARVEEHGEYVLAAHGAVLANQDLVSSGCLQPGLKYKQHQSQQSVGQYFLSRFLGWVLRE